MSEDRYIEALSKYLGRNSELSPIDDEIWKVAGKYPGKIEKLLEQKRDKEIEAAQSKIQKKIDSERAGGKKILKKEEKEKLDKVARIIAEYYDDAIKGLRDEEY